jgi:flavin prenyltransferase
MTSPIVVSITGASGGIYGIRLMKALLSEPRTIHLMISAAGKLVLSHENGYQGEPFARFLDKMGITSHPEARLIEHGADDLFAPPASGSFRHGGMVISPCSMKTLAAVANGYSETLIHRAADVCLKERRPLVLVARETPLSAIHLGNMHRLATCGATILPASPGFYHHPATIEDLVDGVVARILDQLGIAQTLIKQWGV